MPLTFRRRRQNLQQHRRTQQRRKNPAVLKLLLPARKLWRENLGGAENLAAQKPWQRVYQRRENPIIGANTQRR